MGHLVTLCQETSHPEGAIAWEAGEPPPGEGSPKPISREGCGLSAADGNGLHVSGDLLGHLCFCTTFVVNGKNPSSHSWDSHSADLRHLGMQVWVMSPGEAGTTVETLTVEQSQKAGAGTASASVGHSKVKTLTPQGAAPRFQAKMEL